MPSVRRWLRRLMAMTLLPVFAIRMIWKELRSPPATGDQMTDGKTAALAAYFGATYIDGEFAPEFWSHFDNEGLRTTNLAEGWHNGLVIRCVVGCEFILCFINMLSFRIK